MRRIIVFYLIAVVTIGLAAYVSGYRSGGGSKSGGKLGQIQAQLQREAEIVEYFVLSRIPPMLGRTTGLSEWEKALGSTIRLRDGVGEVSAEAVEFESIVAKVRGLEPGQAVVVATDGGERKGFALAYKIKNGNQYLVIFKSRTGAAALPGSGGRQLLVFALIAGVLGAAALAALARWLLAPSRPT